MPVTCHDTSAPGAPPAILKLPPVIFCAMYRLGPGASTAVNWYRKSLLAATNQAGALTVASPLASSVTLSLRTVDISGDCTSDWFRYLVAGSRGSSIWVVAAPIEQQVPLI